MTPDPPEADAGPRLDGLVVFVRDLDASADFYCGLLRMKIVTRESTALLLAGSGSSMMVLRAMPRGEHSLGGIGVQCATWTLHDEEDLRRCERFLQEQEAHVETTSGDGRTVVEGRDPNGLRVIVVYPDPDGTASHKIMARAYTW
jgi:catechol 2,3-dioxygenase-like lactoylglutathione lyase family enzyme